MTERRVSLAVAVVGGLAFAVIAGLLVPWNPVPGGSTTPVDAADVFSPAEIARAEAYARTARLLSWSSLAVSLVVSLLLGFTRWGRRLMDRIKLPWWAAVVAGTAVVLLVGRLATLPFALVLRQQRLDEGLTNQGLGAYAIDQTLTLVVGIVVTSLGLLVLIGCARRWPRAWPAIAGGAFAALVMVGSFAYPLLIEPLFNDFESLPAGALRSEIFEVADREGVPIDDVLVADASRRTTTLNAYVSGYGGTRRVVVYDNLVDDLPDDQALSVVSHELAHARHDDVLVGSVLGAVGAGTAIGLLGLLLGAGWVRRRSGVKSLAEPAAVPLVLALIAVGTLLASPVESTISRQVERRADVVALETTQDPEAFITMQQELALRSIADPTPPAWSQFWFGSHPLTLERIGLARDMQDRHALSLPW